MVGAGGIGCELLKTLALSGFEDIHIMSVPFCFLFFFWLYFIVSFPLLMNLFLLIRFP